MAEIGNPYGLPVEFKLLNVKTQKLSCPVVGGTMDRAAFESTMELADDQVMPCMSPLGYPVSPLVRKHLISGTFSESFTKLFFSVAVVR